jgi:uncharacterized protein (TIGR03437 family)
MLLGHVEGPDVRHTGAPGDIQMSCGDPSNSGGTSCHTNSTTTGGPINASGGSVTAAFSTGSIYVPGGQPITITVTVKDPAANWSGYYGFQMTARLDSDQVNGQAGHFIVGGANQGVFCDTTDNFAPIKGCGTYPSGHPAAGKPVVEFIEHAFPSMNSSAQTTPYTFSWTPPATNVGPVHFYVAGNAVNNDRKASGLDHVYTASYVLTPGAALPPPAISTGGVLNAVSFAVDASNHASPVAPGTLVQVYGSNLGAAEAHAAGAPFPKSLGGVSIKFNGVQAAIKDVVPGGPFPFVNAQVPFEVAPGTLEVNANVNGVDSPAEQTTIIPSSPGVFTIPPNGQGYGILVFSDASSPNPCKCRLAAPSSVDLGYPTAPIARGTGAFFYAAGLGEMTPPVNDGDGTTDPNNPSIANLKPAVWIGDGTTNVQVTPLFAGQAPGFPGVYQINIVVPNNAPTGNVSLWLTTPDGSVTSNKAKIAVQ